MDGKVRLSRMAFFAVVLAALLMLCMAGSVFASTVQRVSVSTAGVQGNADSSAYGVSADGRYVAFDSPATNLVANDTNGVEDVFVYDRVNKTTTRVSVGVNAQSNGASFGGALSADGRYVAFISFASNLVLGDTNGKMDVFVYDCLYLTTTRVSVSSSGAQAGGYSGNVAISANGRYVAFVSDASNLVTGDTNAAPDVFVHDLSTHRTTLVSITSTGGKQNANDFDSCGVSISADGNLVVFSSSATNLVPNDTNGAIDVFLRNVSAKTTTLLSVSSTGVRGNDNSDNAHISADGSRVVFVSSSDNLGGTGGWDVYVRDLKLSTTTSVSYTPAGKLSSGRDSEQPSISADGRYVAFVSIATDLVAGGVGPATGDAGLYVRDLLTKTTTWPAPRAFMPLISGDGKHVAFSSSWNKLVASDTNGCQDAFLVTGLGVSANRPPVVGVITPSPKTVKLGNSVAITGSFTDPDAGDHHTATWQWGDGTASTAGTVTEPGTYAGKVTGTHKYAKTGIYGVKLTIKDSGSATATKTYSYVVVYNPAGSFLHGSGWIMSPAGAYKPLPSLTGKATFSFNVLYASGATVPSGTTTYTLGSVVFKATKFEWLVVMGSKAVFRGTGTINGSGTYGFQVSVIDTGTAIGHKPDLLRMKIWNVANHNALVYDTQTGAANTADPTISLGGGWIAIY